MTFELAEEDMRRGLCGAAHAPALHKAIHDPTAHILDVVVVAPAVAAWRNKPG